MKPGRKDFVSGNNEALAAAVRLFNADGTGFDLSVYGAIRMQVKPSEFHPHPVIDLTLIAGLTTYASAGQAVVNTLEFHAPASATEFLLGEYFYDVVGVRTIGGDANQILVGTITFEQGKTYDVPA